MLQQGIRTRLISSSFDPVNIADIIVTSYHPSDTKVCLKTLKTVGSLTSKEAARSALGSVSFRSKNERKMFFTWLQNVVSNTTEIPNFPTVRKLTSRKKRTNNLLESCRSYLMVRGDNEGERGIVVDDIESLILDIADNIPERLVLDVSALLRKYTFELHEVSLESKIDLKEVFLKELIDISSIYFDVLFSLVLALDIVPDKGRQYASLRKQAAKFQKQRINDTASYSLYLERLIANTEAWKRAKKKIAASGPLDDEGKKGVNISDDDDNNNDDSYPKISRAKNVNAHQWGWSLHSLHVSVNNKELSPLDQWLFEEEKRLLLATPIDTDTSFSDSPSSSFSALTNASTLKSDSDNGGHVDVTTSFITPDEDDQHTSPDFDEPHRFRDIHTLVADTRDQNRCVVYTAVLFKPWCF